MPEENSFPEKMDIDISKLITRQHKYSSENQEIDQYIRLRYLVYSSLDFEGIIPYESSPDEYDTNPETIFQFVLHPNSNGGLEVQGGHRFVVSQQDIGRGVLTERKYSIDLQAMVPDVNLKETKYAELSGVVLGNNFEGKSFLEPLLEQGIEYLQNHEKDIALLFITTYHFHAKSVERVTRRKSLDLIKRVEDTQWGELVLLCIRLDKFTNKDYYTKFLQCMFSIRESDVREGILSRQGEGGELLECGGHEALAAISYQLEESDFLFAYYRGYHLIMAKGISCWERAREFFGKQSSSSSGRCAGPHYSSRKLHIAPAAAPTASQCIPSVGVAWAQKMRNIKNITVCSIGEGATRGGEFYEAVCFAYQNKLPILFVVEDNKYAISTKTDEMSPFKLNIFNQQILKKIDGRNAFEVFRESDKIIKQIRKGEGPFILWCEVDRMKSHSIHDNQLIYRTNEELKNLSDPIEIFSKELIERSILSEQEVKELHQNVLLQTSQIYEQVKTEVEPTENIENEIYGPSCEPSPLPKVYETANTTTLAKEVNRILENGLQAFPNMILFGQDIEDPKGGIFSLTKNLSNQYPERVINAPVAEATIIGTAMGLAMMDFLPVFEIQFVDFIAPGFNLLINQIAHLRWRTGGEWQCPLTLYTTYGATSKGDGLWHGQSNDSWWVHTPGIKVVVPSSPEDVVGLFWTAFHQKDPIIILIPRNILYFSKECRYQPVPLGKAKIVKDGSDITIICWGNMVHESLFAATKLEKKGISTEIIDLRTIAPWDKETVKKSVKKNRRFVVVQEDNKTGGFGATIIAEILQDQKLLFSLLSPANLIAREDVFIPYHPNLKSQALVDSNKIEKQISQIFNLSENCTFVGQTNIASLTNNVSSSDQPLSNENNIVELTIPQMGKSSQRVIITKFCCQPGTHIKKDEIIYEIETEKSSFSIESPYSGYLVEWLEEEGTTIEVGDPIAKVQTLGKHHSNKLESQKFSKNVDRKQTPEIKEHKGGEIKFFSQQQQILNFRFRESQKNVIANTLIKRIDFTNLKAFVKDNLQKEKLITEFQFFAYLLTQTIKKFPKFRSLIMDDSRFSQYPYLNLGIAVETLSKNLDIAVIEKSDLINFDEFLTTVQKNVTSVTEEVNSFKIPPSFILSYLGDSGIFSGIPLLVSPSVAILGYNSPYKMENKVYLNLSLTVDHRLINGIDAAKFLEALEERLLNPSFQESIKPEKAIDHSLSWSDKLELTITNLLEDTTKIEVHEHLGDYGLDSLHIKQIKQVFAKNYHIDIPIEVFFEYPTIHKLANYLEKRSVTKQTKLFEK